MERKYLESGKWKSYTQMGMYEVQDVFESEICSRYPVNAGDAEITHLPRTL